MSFLNRIFLTGLLLGAPILLLAQENEEKAPRPNFIHIMVDDMAADAMGFCGKYPFLKTPHLDRLAATGIVFNQFFVTTALCSPSRASILTGRYGHATGVPDNSVYRDPNPELPTYPELLKQAGYATAHIGKWHMGHGDQPRDGFTHWYGFDGQGVYFDPVINDDGSQVKVEGYITDILTDDAIAFIRENQDRPFAINLWHKAAHGPFEPAPRHAAMVDRIEMAKPVTWDNDLRDKPNWMRRSRAHSGALLEGWLASEGKPVPEAVPPVAFSPERTLQMRSHLMTLPAVDDSVGRIVATLDELGLLDNTVIIFTADNGFFLGEFARGDKRLAYEPSIRVPMILHYPGLGTGGRQVQALGLNVDFAPTLLDWAGIEIPDTMQGASLLPVLKEESAGVRDAFLYEYFQEEFAPGFPTMLGIRTSEWKYICFPYEKDEIEELYNLAKDPHETVNLAGDPQHLPTLKRMKALMARELNRLDYHKPAYQYNPANYPKKED